MHPRRSDIRLLDDEDEDEDVHTMRGFVKSLELEELSVPIGKDQRYVDGGSLISFVSSLTGQQKQDVLDSSLLAQLAANKKYNKQTEFIDWYEFYSEVMTNVGWVLQDFNFKKYQATQAEFKLSQVTLEILSVLVGGEAEILAVVKSTLDGLAKSKEGVTLFSDKSTSGKNGNFQILPCTLDKSNQVNVAFMGFDFRANKREDNFFFFTWKEEEIELLCSTQTCTLNEEMYAKVRGEVRKKVAKYQNDYVVNLPI